MAEEVVIKDPAQILNLLEQKIGFDSNKTLLFVQNSEDENVKTATLLKGDWQNEPWLSVDEHERIYTMISLSSLQKIADNINQLQQENFKLKLEKAIWKYIPIDFADVWSVATNEIKANGTRFSEDELDVLVNKIRQKYPNLFVDVKRFIRGKDD